MSILANNFICRSNYFLTDKFTSSERTFSTNGMVAHGISISDQSSDSQILTKKAKIPLYLNIKWLRNKVTDIQEINGKLSLDYFVISKTKSDESFPSSQFNIEKNKIKIQSIKMVVN